MMTEKTLEFRKETSIVGVRVPWCDYDQRQMTLVGSAGCSHASEYTYFYQCKGCKDVDSSERPMESSPGVEAMLEGGWKPL